MILAGRLISQDKLGGDKWEVISLPAIAEDNDPIGRKVGQALWEDRYNIDVLTRP